MRQFWIQNDRGESWDLNGPDGVILALPAGLGARWTVKTADLGHGFFRELETDAVPAEPVTGELNFLPPLAYPTYRAFARFAAGSAELRLVYCPFGSDEFTCLGRLEYLQKGELAQTAILNVPVSFIPFTPWYQPRDLELTMTEASSDAWVLDESPFSDDLVFASSDVGSWAVEIPPSGDQPASLVFTFDGAAAGPVLTLTGVNSGTEYGRCAVDAEVTGLRFSTKYLDSYVTDGAGADLIDDVSPGHDPFFRVPMTEPCVLRLSASAALTGSAQVAVNYYFRSV